MAGLKSRLSEEMKESLRAGDKLRLATLRLLLASIKNHEVDVGHELEDGEVLDVVAREVKRRKEAAEAYERAGRQDLLEKERREQEVLEAYLPEQLSDDDVRALVHEAVDATGAEGPKELGKVIGYVMGKAKGRADGKRVSELVRERLGG